MMHLRAAIYLTLSALLLLLPSAAQAQQAPPCPFTSLADTTRLWGILDSTNTVLANNVYCSKKYSYKLDGIYRVMFYRRFAEPDPSMNQYWERLGYDEGELREGLKEGPWRCRRSAPVEASWWECYHLGQLVSTTAPPPVPPQHRKEKRKKSCR